MKICVIYGSPRRGNTYRAAQIFKNELSSRGDFEFTEFFLPKDLPHFCNGCYACFEKGEDKCPHAQYTQPIAQAIREAAGLIVTTPVYSLAESAEIKAFLDHFSHIYMNHRPMKEMFSKIAIVISTTAGMGTGYAIKTIRRSLRFWGMRRVQKCGLGIYAAKWDDMSPEKQQKFTDRLCKKARAFYILLSNEKKPSPYIFTRVYYLVCKKLLLSFPDGHPDKEYWREKGWFTVKPF